MVSGLFSAKTVVHLSTAPATASFEHAVAVCTETPALNRSTTALIARRVRIISSPHLFGDITNRSGPPTERIAHLKCGRRLLRCGISIWPTTAVGHDRAFVDVASMSGLLPHAAVQRTTMDDREV